VKSNSKELPIHMKIISMKNSGHYCIPIYDTILLPDTDETLIIVLPILHDFTKPHFTNVYEALHCVLHLTKGLSFLHENRIAHNDIDARNVHMQTNKMFFKGWHPMQPKSYHPGDPTRSQASLRPDPPYIPRTLSLPQYLFMDFGNSHLFQPGEHSYYIGTYGTNFPPEMTDSSVSDVFAAEVWCFGSMMQEVFGKEPREDYELFRPILEPWVDRMLNPKPHLRPTAEEVLMELQAIIKNLSDSDLRKTLVSKVGWDFSEVRHGVFAILNGEGDERVLFARLRGDESADSVPFKDLSIKDKAELIKRTFRFILNASYGGNVLQWVRPKPKQHGSKN